MAATGNGSTKWLGTFASTISPLTSAYSMSFWYKPAAAAVNSAPNMQPMALVNTGGGTPTLYNVSFAWSHSDAATWKAAIHRQADGTFKLAQLPFVPAFGVWIHICITYDGTTVRIYYNGVLANSVAATNLSGAAGNPNVSICAWNDGASDFDASPVAEASIWSVCLTDDEVLALSRGRAVSSVQFGSVVWYNPLNSITSTVGPNLTNHNSVVFNTTSFVETSGGVALGGAGTTTKTTYHHTPSGGIALGGAGTISKAIYRRTPTGGIALGGNGTIVQTLYNHIMSGGIALGGTFPTGSTYHHTMSGGIALGGRRGFPVVQPVGSGAVIVDTGREPAHTTK